MTASKMIRYLYAETPGSVSLAIPLRAVSRPHAGMAVNEDSRNCFKTGLTPMEDLILLYWRICHEVIQAGFDLTSVLFACAIHCASRVFRSDGPIQHTGTDAARATVPARAAATRCPDRFIPGRSRCADSRGVNVSGRDCRSGSLDAKSFQAQGRRVGKRSRQAVLGPER
jgi:hypothetical protein